MSSLTSPHVLPAWSPRSSASSSRALRSSPGGRSETVHPRQARRRHHRCPVHSTGVRGRVAGHDSALGLDPDAPPGSWCSHLRRSSGLTVPSFISGEVVQRGRRRWPAVRDAHGCRPDDRRPRPEPTSHSPSHGSSSYCWSRPSPPWSSRPAGCRSRLGRLGLEVVWTLIGGTLAAGSANAINCYLDRDIDSLMSRTRAARCPLIGSSPRMPSSSAWRSASPPSP